MSDVGLLESKSILVIGGVSSLVPSKGRRFLALVESTKRFTHDVIGRVQHSRATSATSLKLQL